MAEHIVALLGEEALLQRYLQKAKARKCVPLTRQDARYPAAVRRKLGLDSPGCLWAKGDIRLLQGNLVSLVGSRTLNEENRLFAVPKLLEEGKILHISRTDLQHIHIFQQL